MGTFNSNYNVFHNTKINFLNKLQCNTQIKFNETVNSFWYVSVYVLQVLELSVA